MKIIHFLFGHFLELQKNPATMKNQIFFITNVRIYIGLYSEIVLNGDSFINLDEQCTFNSLGILYHFKT